jgi:hypothetical protein
MRDNKTINMSYTIPRGYTITPKVKFLRTKEGKKRTQLVELTHKRKGIAKLFGNEEYAIKYIQSLEINKVTSNALAGKGAPSIGKHAILLAGKDAVADKELNGIYDDMTNEEATQLNNPFYQPLKLI